MLRADLSDTAAARIIARGARLRLGMMQLSPFGLSEQWLLRDGGDRHWSLIADALGQSGGIFRDAQGHAVYAAFSATELTLHPPPRALLGTELSVSSHLYALAPNRLGSEHHLHGPEGPLGRLRMITCFLRHDESGSNRRLLRSTPRGLGDLAPAPRALLAFHDRARGRARAALANPPAGPPALRYQPVPALDFNAVGLLYFPTFARIAEGALPISAPLARREIVYLGNIDPGETISATGGPPDLRLMAGTRPLAMIASAHHGAPVRDR
ncbi:hypothetical protein FGG78_29690 [Thioclava sp. BHET1]|nr:hypothetical protein FGG78_29690 [Thioclava sp. BHET1]